MKEIDWKWKLAFISCHWRKRKKENSSVSSKCKDLVDPKKSSNLREHCQQFHQGVIVQFGCAVVKTFPGDPLSRQLKEAILIDSHAGPSMNDKGEWVRPASIRIRAERSWERTSGRYYCVSLQFLSKANAGLENLWTFTEKEIYYFMSENLSVST